MSVGRKIRYILFSIRVFKNWRAAIKRVLANLPITLHILRDDTVIHSSDDVLVVIDEIFDNQTYGHAAIRPTRQDAVIVDIGAHIGCYTLWARKHTNAKVIAYEPLPSNFELLKQNIAANNLADVSAINKAVSAASTPVWISADRVSSGNRTSVDRTNRSEGVWVDTVTLYDILSDNNLSHIDLLKMDCEGAEGAIIQSATCELLGSIQRCVLEFHDDCSVLDHSSLAKKLTECGFRTVIQWDGHSPYGYIFATR